MLIHSIFFFIAGDDAKIRVWKIPEGGLVETLTEPECVLRGKKRPLSLNQLFLLHF